MLPSVLLGNSRDGPNGGGFAARWALGPSADGLIRSKRGLRCGWEDRLPLRILQAADGAVNVLDHGRGRLVTVVAVLAHGLADYPNRPARDPRVDAARIGNFFGQMLRYDLRR